MTENVYAYGFDLFLHKRSLKRWAGVGEDEAACFSFDVLPRQLARIDGGPVTADLDKALKDFRASGDKLVFWELEHGGYRAFASLERPADYLRAINREKMN